MRAFLAIEVPEFPDMPSRPEGHLTLKFLGDLEPERVPALSEAVRPAVRAIAPFEFVVEGVGAFPSTERPRVVWAGVSEGRDQLVYLADQVEAACAGAGILRDLREFAPHVTLLRARGPRGAGRAHGLLEKYKGRRFGAATAREVVLFESELRPEGAIHRPVERFPLDGAA